MVKSILVWLLAVLGIGIAALPAWAGYNSVAAFAIWPDTGQTKCYDVDNVITCPSAGADFYGQDAQYAGPARSYTDLGSGMIQDNVTGLIWEQKTNMDDIADYANPHDADNTYTWCDTNSNTNGGNAGTCDGNDTQGFINQLNSANYGGHNDWRLPTIKELTTLVDLGRIIDPVFAATTQLGWYWSSTTVANYTIDAWRVGFGSGYDDGGDKWSGYHVRAVRGGQIPSAINQFIDNGDTVTDTITGLEWQKATMGPMTWKEALAAAENLTLAGKSDWRLPDKNELRSLVDYSRYNPAIDPVFFANTQSSAYWSSTTYYSDFAWRVSFYNGYAGSGFIGSGTGDGHKSSGYYVRCVRGGHSHSISAPVAAFTANPLNGTASLAVTFVDQSTGNITSWSWDFDGNGTVDSTVQSPNYIYNTPGTYTVALTVSGPGGTDLETRNAYITVTTASSTSAVLSVAVTGQGTVSSAPVGINCGVDCQETYPAGTTVSLAAAPAVHYAFIGWSGDYTGSTNSLNIENMQTNVTVQAEFATDADGDGIADMYDTGDSDGDGISDMAEIRCGSDPANPASIYQKQKFPWPMFLPAITHKVQ